MPCHGNATALQLYRSWATLCTFLGHRKVCRCKLRTVLFTCRNFVSDVFLFLLKHFETYKGPVRFWIGTKLLVFPRTPQDIFTVLTDPCCMEKSEYLQKAIPIDALFSAPGKAGAANFFKWGPR